MTARESTETAVAEWEWAYKAWLNAIMSRIIRQMIVEIIGDILNPRQKDWEAFTACQSITPR